MPTLLLTLTAMAFAASFILLRWDTKYRGRRRDRSGIFTAGLFAGLGLVGIAVGIYWITA